MTDDRRVTKRRAPWADKMDREERWIAFRREHSVELQALPLNRAHGRLDELRAEFLAAERVRAQLSRRVTRTITLANGTVLVPVDDLDEMNVIGHSNLYRTGDGQLWRRRS